MKSSIYLNRHVFVMDLLFDESFPFSFNIFMDNRISRSACASQQCNQGIYCWSVYSITSSDPISRQWILICVFTVKFLSIFLMKWLILFLLVHI